ncbi:ArsR/SmtB family transcription factor [Brevibacillus centrosporus]|uniref:ArsR/SmtB family transcription factor n=1 Tax=Brevibacillus centrosporus TaxID=54910 RepID=UPI00382B9869
MNVGFFFCVCMAEGELTCNYLVAYNQDMDKVFKALSDATRRQLLDLLYQNNGQTLSELCDHLDMTRQSVTKHLVILEEAHLVVVEWQGRHKRHYLNAAPIAEIYDRWIGKYERQRIDALVELKRKLEEDTHG